MCASVVTGFVPLYFLWGKNVPFFPGLPKKIETLEPALLWKVSECRIDRAQSSEGSAEPEIFLSICNIFRPRVRSRHHLSLQDSDNMTKNQGDNAALEEDFM